MHFNHERDQQRLAQLPYGTKRKQVQLKRLHEFVPNPDYNAHQKQLFTIKEWIVTGRSIATAESAGLCRYFCNLLEKKLPIDPAMNLLLDLIDDVPDESCQATIAKHEHTMLTGFYDAFVTDQTKYNAQLKRLLADPEYQQRYKQMDDIFNLKSREAFNGLIVCNRTSDRTTGPDDFDWSDDKAQFDHVFRAFCRRFNLYGLEYGQPLLLKVKVETTPFGVTVHYPKWMSVDVRRDLAHQEIMNLLKAYGADRQGAKLTPGQLEKEELALRVLRADGFCQEKGWVGARRQRYIIKDAGLPPGTSDRTIRKLLELGRKLRANEKTPEPKTPAQPVAEPNRHVKMARARAHYLALTPEAQEEFRKWIAAAGAV